MVPPRRNSPRAPRLVVFPRQAARRPKSACLPWRGFTSRHPASATILQVLGLQCLGGQLAINAASLLLSPHDYHRGLRGGLPALLTDSPDGPIQPYWNANIVKQGRLTLTIHCQ